MALGFAFPFLSEVARDRIGRVVTLCAPAAVRLAFFYVVGPPEFNHQSAAPSVLPPSVQDIATAIVPAIKAEIERALASPEHRLQQTQSLTNGKLEELAKGLAEVKKRLSHTLNTGGLDDEDYNGRPLGFAWNSTYLNVSWVDLNQRTLGASGFFPGRQELWCKINSVRTLHI